MELRSRVLAFSSLIGAQVVDGDGRKLGRVYEVRGHHERDGAIVLDELLVGRGALLKRLRGPSARARGIPWESVASLEGERIRVTR